MSAAARPMLLAAAAASVWFAASACTTSSAPRSTPTAAIASSPTPVPPTPDPGIDISGSTYRFRKKGYAVDVPQGWTASPNNFNDVSGGQFPTDVMFPIGASGDVSPAISIECLKANAAQGTTDAFRDARAAFLAQIGKSVAAPRPVNIGGQDGYAIDYLQELARASGAIAIEKTDAVAVVGGCRWLISLSTPGGQRAAHTAEFEAMLRSMSFFAPE